MGSTNVDLDAFLANTLQELSDFYSNRNVAPNSVDNSSSTSNNKKRKATPNLQLDTSTSKKLKTKPTKQINIATKKQRDTTNKKSKNEEIKPSSNKQVHETPIKQIDTTTKKLKVTSIKKINKSTAKEEDSSPIQQINKSTAKEGDTTKLNKKSKNEEIKPSSNKQVHETPIKQIDATTKKLKVTSIKKINKSTAKEQDSSPIQQINKSTAKKGDTTTRPNKKSKNKEINSSSNKEVYKTQTKQLDSTTTKKLKVKSIKTNNKSNKNERKPSQNKQPSNSRTKETKSKENTSQTEQLDTLLNQFRLRFEENKTSNGKPTALSNEVTVNDVSDDSLINATNSAEKKPIMSNNEELDALLNQFRLRFEENKIRNGKPTTLSNEVPDVSDYSLNNTTNKAEKKPIMSSNEQSDDSVSSSVAIVNSEKEVKQYFVYEYRKNHVYRKKIVDAVRKLRAECKKEKPKLNLTCANSESPFDQVHWSSANYIVRQTRECLLRRNWHLIPKLLKLLMAHKKTYKNYVKELSFILFLLNKEEYPEYLDEFLSTAFTSIPFDKKVHEFDMWYRSEVKTDNVNV